jgi:hypothetical protein
MAKQHGGRTVVIPSQLVSDPGKKKIYPDIKHAITRRFSYVADVDGVTPHRFLTALII